MKQKYPLKNVKVPNLYEEIFKYDQIPKVVFDKDSVRQHLPKDFWWQR